MRKIFIILSLLFSLMLTSANAVEVSQEAKITGLYVAFFNRAADQEGLDYWTDKAVEVAKQGGDVSAVFKTLSAGFATHPTFTSTYAHLEDKVFVEAIYRNALGRDGDAEGIAYWTDLIDRGMSRSDMVATFVELSMVTDLTPANYPSLSTGELTAAQLRQDLITNKVNASLAFTNQLGVLSNVVDSDNPENDPAYIASSKIISEVTEDVGTVSKVLNFLDGLIGVADPIKVIAVDIDDAWDNFKNSLQPTVKRIPISESEQETYAKAYYTEAYLAKRIYTESYKTKNLVDNSWELVEYTCKINGFEAGLYKKENDYKIAIGGTTSQCGDSENSVISFLLSYGNGVIDAATDLFLLSNFPFKPNQAKSALEFLGEGIIPTLISSNAISSITGHSLGGGLAQYVGLYVGIKTITFNTAPMPFTRESIAPFRNASSLSIVSQKEDGEVTGIEFTYADKITNIMTMKDPVSLISLELMALEKYSKYNDVLKKWYLNPIKTAMFIDYDFEIDYLITGEEVYLPIDMGNMGGNHSMLTILNKFSEYQNLECDNFLYENITGMLISSPTCVQKWNLWNYLTLGSTLLRNDFMVLYDQHEGVMDTNKAREEFIKVAQSTIDVLNVGGAIAKKATKETAIAISAAVADNMTRYIPHDSSISSEIVTRVEGIITTSISEAASGSINPVIAALNAAPDAMGTIFTFYDAFKLNSVVENLNEINVAQEYLYRYYQLGGSVQKVAEYFTDNIYSSFESTIIAVAKTMGLENKWYGDDYSYEKVLGIIDYYRSDFIPRITGITMVENTDSPSSPAIILTADTVIQWEENVNSEYADGAQYRHRYMLALYANATCRYVDLNLEIDRQNEDKKPLYENTNKIYTPDSALQKISGCEWSSTSSVLSLSFFYTDAEVSIPLTDGALSVGDTMGESCNTSDGCKVTKIYPIAKLEKDDISGHAMEVFNENGKVQTWYFRNNYDVQIYNESNDTVQASGNWTLSSSYINILNDEGRTVLRTANTAYETGDFIDFTYSKGYISDIQLLTQ